LGFILGLGILVIFLAVLNILPEFLASIYGQTINAMNLIVNWVSSQEQFLFKNISITLLQVIVCYLLIITFVKYITKRSYANLRLLLISILVSQSVFIYTAFINSNEEFIIFHKSRYSLIGIKNGKNLIAYHDFDRLVMDKDKMITNFKIGNFISKMEQDSIKTVYGIKDKKLLVIDSFGIFNIKSFKPNYVLLRNSPKLNLNRLIDSLQPEMVIADGSNYKSYVNRWENTCKNKKLLFHSTSEKGAFIIK
jgi:competence protein ComEC